MLHGMSQNYYLRRKEMHFAIVNCMCTAFNRVPQESVWELFLEWLVLYSAEFLKGLSVDFFEWLILYSVEFLMGLSGDCSWNGWYYIQ